MNSKNMMNYDNNKENSSIDYIRSMDKRKNVLMSKSLQRTEHRENNVAPIAPKKRRFVMTKAKRRKIFGPLKKEDDDHKGHPKKNDSKESAGKSECVDGLQCSHIEFTREKPLLVNTKVEFITKSDRLLPPTPTTAVSELSMTSPQTAMMKKVLAEAKAKSAQLATNDQESYAALEKVRLPVQEKSHQLYTIDECANSKKYSFDEDRIGSMPRNVDKSLKSSSCERANLSSMQHPSENPPRSNFRKKIAHIGTSAASTAKRIINVLEDKVTECFLPTPTTPVNATKKSTKHRLHCCY
jgi:hypothetical protein